MGEARLPNISQLIDVQYIIEHRSEWTLAGDRYSADATAVALWRKHDLRAPVIQIELIFALGNRAWRLLFVTAGPECGNALLADVGTTAGLKIASQCTRKPCWMRMSPSPLISWPRIRDDCTFANASLAKRGYGLPAAGGHKGKGWIRDICWTEANTCDMKSVETD